MNDGKTPAQLIDQRIEELGDWRGELLARIRQVIKEAEPDVVERSGNGGAFRPGTTRE
jgi:hypothetical protein